MGLQTWNQSKLGTISRKPTETPNPWVLQSCRTPPPFYAHVLGRRSTPGPTGARGSLRRVSKLKDVACACRKPTEHVLGNKPASRAVVLVVGGDGLVVFLPQIPKKSDLSR